MGRDSVEPQAGQRRCSNRPPRPSPWIPSNTLAGYGAGEVTLAGLGRMTVGDIEERRNQGNVGILTVEKIAKVLHVSAAWLAYGVGSSEMILKSVDDAPSGKPH
jgi:hypothetical protein